MRLPGWPLSTAARTSILFEGWWAPHLIPFHSISKLTVYHNKRSASDAYPH